MCNFIFCKYGVQLFIITICFLYVSVINGYLIFYLIFILNKLYFIILHKL